jgi:hypothetical protein
MKQPAFDSLRDLTPITLVDYFDLILCANPALPIKDVRQLVAYAKANPGKLSYGTAGVGAMNHVGTEWFKMMTGIDIVHVPYRGDEGDPRPARRRRTDVRARDGSGVHHAGGVRQPDRQEHRPVEGRRCAHEDRGGMKP